MRWCPGWLARPYKTMLLLCLTSSLPLPMQAAPVFSFGVISHTDAASPDGTVLSESIAASDADNLAFVVVNGIKTVSESCSDKLLFQRKEVFQNAKNGLIVVLAGSDWTACTNHNGDSLAMERLNRIRELFFSDEFSFGGSKLPLMRQARMPRFRTYGENLQWEVGSTVFATLNLPANNNAFLAAAGRNSEFEERLIADRDWLHRLFGVARQKHATGIVLFCDADPMATTDSVARTGVGAHRDGYVEIRKQILALAAHFPGKIVVVHGQGEAGNSSNFAGQNIIWRGNLGSIALTSGWFKITVDPTTPVQFSRDSIEQVEPSLVKTVVQ